MQKLILYLPIYVLNQLSTYLHCKGAKNRDIKLPHTDVAAHRIVARCLCLCGIQPVRVELNTSSAIYEKQLTAFTCEFFQSESSEIESVLISTGVSL